MSADPSSNTHAETAASAAVLIPAARRALVEAESRRKLRDAAAAALPAETGGRKGPDPVRYGDWEKNGIASDF
jgi:hypothetical protein